MHAAALPQSVPPEGDDDAAATLPAIASVLAPSRALEVTAWLAQLGAAAGATSAAGAADAAQGAGGSDQAGKADQAANTAAAAAEAAQQVYTMLYGELHRIARSHMRRESSDHTLGPTALVHEAWFRLSEQTRTQWQNRNHFMAVASTMMRRILVDHAVARRTLKRDAALEPISNTLLDRHGPALDRDVVAVHEALLALEEHDPRAAKVVELKFFGGLEIDEIAQALSISAATVKRDWTLARAWLRRELGGQPLA